MTPIKMFMTLYNAIAVERYRLHDQNDDVINVKYVHPTWHLDDLSAQDFEYAKRLFGEDLDVFLTDDGLKFERGDLNELKRFSDLFNR